jgi:hypothetical protein
MHYETKQIELINACQTKADFEKTIYDLADGRVSRSQCKMIVSKMAQIGKSEKAKSANLGTVLSEIAGSWLINIAGKKR